MRIKPQRTGKSDFLSVYKKALTYTTARRGDPSRLYNLRCSQLPFCGASVWLNYGLRGMIQEMDMMMAFYVTVGTAVHTVMQTYLSMSGQFLADYECRECGKKYPLSHVHECCGFPTQYEEVNLDYKGIQGHIDGIFKDRLGRYWIIDFKTTSMTAAPGKVNKPGIGYERQVMAYAWLLRKQYGIKVEGVMLIFIPRDNPKDPVIWEALMTPKMWERAYSDLKKDRALHQLTMKAKTLEDAKILFENKCGNEWCDFCSKPKSELVNLAKRVLKTGNFPIKKESK